MTIETTLYDIAQHLTHPDDQAELIADAVASGDSAVIRDALNIVARARGMAEVARGAGITREPLSEALGPDGDPHVSTFLGVLGVLGMKLSASNLPRPPDLAGMESDSPS